MQPTLPGAFEFEYHGFDCYEIIDLWYLKVAVKENIIDEGARGFTLPILIGGYVINGEPQVC